MHRLDRQRDGRERPEFNRAAARRCRELADAVADGAAQAMLLDNAEALDARAALLEALTRRRQSDAEIRPPLVG